MADSLQTLTEHIRSITLHTQDGPQDQQARAELLQAARELVTTLEQPDEVVSLVAFSGGRNMCVRLAIDMRLFHILSDAKQPMTVGQLSDECKAEEGLVARIVRTLVGMGFAAQVEMPSRERAFTATGTTRQMTKPSTAAGVRFL